MNEILTYLKLHRHPSYAKKTDIKRIQEAKQTGNWSKVYSSTLYRLHSGEYCELLGLLHNKEVF